MAESGIIKTYLDFLVDIPWYKTSQDRTDLKMVKEILDHNHYGLEKVKDRIIEYLSVQIMTKKNPQTILCLVGPPGVGKTSFIINLAISLRKLGYKVVIIDADIGLANVDILSGAIYKKTK